MQRQMFIKFNSNANTRNVPPKRNGLFWAVPCQAAIIYQLVLLPIIREPAASVAIEKHAAA